MEFETTSSAFKDYMLSLIENIITTGLIFESKHNKIDLPFHDAMNMKVSIVLNYLSYLICENASDPKDLIKKISEHLVSITEHRLKMEKKGQ